MPIDRRVFSRSATSRAGDSARSPALRVRHLDLDEEPLGSIVFARSYATRLRVQDDRARRIFAIAPHTSPLRSDLLRFLLRGELITADEEIQQKRRP